MIEKNIRGNIQLWMRTIQTVTASDFIGIEIENSFATNFNGNFMILSEVPRKECCVEFGEGNWHLLCSIETSCNKNR